MNFGISFAAIVLAAAWLVTSRYEVHSIDAPRYRLIALDRWHGRIISCHEDDIAPISFGNPADSGSEILVCTEWTPLTKNPASRSIDDLLEKYAPTGGPAEPEEPKTIDSQDRK